MARIPPTKRLLTEDFPDQKAWIGKLIQPLNQYMEIASAALNRGLNVSDNLDAQIETLTLTEGQTVRFKVTTRARPLGVIISSHANLAGSSPSISAALYPVWEYIPATNQIKISKIYGLNSGEKYRLTLFIHTT